jgi:hypothetical protein
VFMVSLLKKACHPEVVEGTLTVFPFCPLPPSSAFTRRHDAAASKTSS